MKFSLFLLPVALAGSFGLLFGYLYRKFGIQYAMVSRAMFHIVSKLIWTIL